MDIINIFNAYEYTMVFCKSADHGNADGLSRLTSEGPPVVVPDHVEIITFRIFQGFTCQQSLNKNPYSQESYIISCI